MDTRNTFHQLLGLSKDWKVDNIELSIEAHRVEILVEWNGGEQAPCPECGALCPVYDLREERGWRHLDTMQFETVIRCRVPRIKCEEHGCKTIQTPWADKHSRFSLMFEGFAVTVLQACSNVEAARRLLRLSWGQADELRRRAVERGLERRGQTEIPYLGLDEKSFGKGHDYISVMADLDQGRVLDVTPERKKDAAEALLTTLSEEQRQGVMAIAMDMWPPFMSAAQAYLPGAILVHDKFHVVKHLGEAVDQVRKGEKKALSKDGDDSLKGAKYLFLKNFDNLSEDQRERFEERRDSTLKTARAWAIKDQFGGFWDHEFVADAREYFQYWYY